MLVNERQQVVKIKKAKLSTVRKTGSLAKGVELSTQKIKTEGDYLRDLYIWTDETIARFTNSFNRTRQWAQNAFKWERIPIKEKIAICRAYNIPMEYFEGKFKLPLTKINYKNQEDPKFKEMEFMFEEMKSKYISAQDKIISLQDELNRLMKESKQSNS